MELTMEHVEAAVGVAFLARTSRDTEITKLSTLDALGFDSLSQVELIMAIEEELLREIDDDAWIDRWSGTTTVQDVVNDVARSLGVKE